MSHIVNQLISYRGTLDNPIIDKHINDWLRSASTHPEVPDSIKAQILTTLGPVPVIDEASRPSAAD
ncbi:MAG: hypothetical protein K2W94_01940 [Alphaproteobacteria bacterium]|nr:hypothetical protein [Alphaproteobacteria bacterium]